MALTADKLINRQRFRNDNSALFLLYLPLGIIIFALRVVLGLIIWTASIILPNKPAVTQVLTHLACWTFGIFVNVKGTRDPRSSVLVANYASYLDSLAASRVLGTISLRKWKVPPFFATALGIRNTAQFIRKQHFADSPNTPVLIQPEGGPTNGKALLQFNDWPFQVTTMVQPVAISVSRPWTHVSAGTAWRDAAWSALAPRTAYTLHLLPPATPAAARAALAAALQVEMSDLKWEDLSRSRPRPPRRDTDVTRLAKQVKEVLPRVPMKDILKDLAITRSVDVTITNFLEGVIPYNPEPENIEPRPSTSQAQPSQPKYITPVPTGVFPKNAKERQLSFQERKAQMIAEARKRYIEKHGLNIALNNC